MEQNKRVLMKFLKTEGISPAKASNMLASTLSLEDRHLLYCLKHNRGSFTSSKIRITNGKIIDSFKQ